MKNIQEILGTNIKNRRTQLCLEQRDITSMTGITGQTIIRIEKGRTWPQMNNLESLAKALKCEVIDFFEIPIDPGGAIPKNLEAIVNSHKAELWEMSNKLKSATEENQSLKELIEPFEEFLRELHKKMETMEFVPILRTAEILGVNLEAIDEASKTLKSNEETIAKAMAKAKLKNGSKS